MGYCTVKEVREFNQDPDMDAGVLRLLVDPIAQAIDKYCRRTFDTATASRSYDMHDTKSIRLRDDLISLTSVTTNAGQTFTSAELTLRPKAGPPFARIEFKQGIGDYFSSYLSTWPCPSSIDHTLYI